MAEKDKADSLAVYTNPKKIVLIFAICLAVLGIFVYMLSDADLRSQSAMLAATIFMTAIMGLSTLLTGYILYHRMVYKTVSLLLDEEGITIGGIRRKQTLLVPWSEISGFGNLKLRSSKFILVFLNDPEQFVARQGSAMQKRLMSWNIKHYKTPVTIQTDTLDIKEDKLMEQLVKRHKKSRVK